MLYGNCISFKNLQHVKILKETGFDYAETALSPMYAAAKPEIEDFSGALEQSGIECMAANVLFPGDIRLTGEKAEPQKAGDYIGEIFEKTKGLKFKIVVFGSGGARKVPEGFSKESAIEQIAGLIEAHLLPAAEKYGFVLAIEELNRGETNILNSLGECINLAKRANSPKVGLLADLYHIGLENDDIALLPKHKEMLAHCHIANPINSRFYPHEGDEAGALYEKFFSGLKSAGYGGGLSIEGSLGFHAADASVPDWVSAENKQFYAESKKSLEYIKSF